MEKPLFHELPANTFHSAILTTYSINSYFFQQQVVKELSRKGIFNISVLTDAAMLTEHLRFMAQYERHQDRYYGITGIGSKGAFHPKLNYFVGKDALLCIVGSGNLTSAGHGKNFEIFTTLYADTKNQQHLSLLKEIWTYIELSSVKLKGAAKQQIFAAKENCSLFKTVSSPGSSSKTSFVPSGKNLETAFICDKAQNSFLSQLVALLPKKINLISVVAPYYDVKGELLLKLREIYNFPVTRISLQNHFGQPPSKLKNLHKLKIYDWTDVGKRLMNKKTEETLLHAKIFFFEGETYSYCLIGSANPSVAAFGNETINGVNQEAGLLLRSKTRDFIKELGLSFSQISTHTLGDFKSSIEPPSAITSKTANKLQIISAEKTISQFDVYFQKSLSIDDFEVVLLDRHGAQVVKSALKNFQSHYNISVEPEILKEAQQIVVLDKVGNEISNRQLLLNSVQIQNQNPYIANRSLNNILQKIGDHLGSPLDFIEYLTDLNTYARDTQVGGHSGVRKMDREDEDWTETKLAHKTYDEFIEELKNYSIPVLAHAQAGYSKVRALDILLNHFAIQYEKKQEEEFDFEESENVDESLGESEAFAETEDRPEQPEIDNKGFIDVSSERKKIVKLIAAYKNSLGKFVASANSRLGLVDLAEFILIAKLAVDCGTFVITNKIKGKVKDSVQPILQLRANLDDMSACPGISLSVIQKFAEYLTKLNGSEDYSENRYYQEKYEKYAQIAATFSFLLFGLISLSNRQDERLNVAIRQRVLNLYKEFYVRQGFEIDTEFLKMVIRRFQIKIWTQQDIVDSVIEWHQYAEREFIAESPQTTSGDFVWIDGSGYSIVKEEKPKKGIAI